jgi:hypothetical protein
MASHLSRLLPLIRVIRVIRGFAVVHHLPYASVVPPDEGRGIALDEMAKFESPYAEIHWSKG